MEKCKYSQCVAQNRFSLTNYSLEHKASEGGHFAHYQTHAPQPADSQAANRGRGFVNRRDCVGLGNVCRDASSYF